MVQHGGGGGGAETAFTEKPFSVKLPTPANENNSQTSTGMTEVLQRFIHGECLDVPIRNQVVQVYKEAATGWVNVSSVAKQLGLDRTPRVLKTHLEKVCADLRPNRDVRLFFRQEGRPRPAVWADPPIALELLQRLVGNVDLSVWAVRRAFCATDDTWYIQDPLDVVPNIRTARTLTLADGATLLDKQFKFFENDPVKVLVCKTLVEMADAFRDQGRPVQVAELSPAVIKHLFQQCQASGLFLDAPPPVIAPISVVDMDVTSTTTPTLKEEHKEDDAVALEVSWQVPNPDEAARLYTEPAIVRDFKLFQSRFPDPTGINFNDEELLAEFYQKEQVELYHLHEQYHAYKTLKDEHKTALHLVAILELVFKVFRDRFVFQPYQDLVSRKAVPDAELIPSGIRGHASPEMPLAVLFHVATRFCHDNPALAFVPDLSQLSDPKTYTKVMKLAAAFLSYRPDYAHCQVVCENQEQITAKNTMESRRKHRHSEIRWPHDKIPVPDKPGSFYEPRVFLNCDLVLNVDLRVPYVPWNFVQKRHDRFADWFKKNSDGMTMRVALPKATPTSHAPRQDQGPDRERVIEYIKTQYATHRYWTFSAEQLVPDKHIGTIYVPFVTMWIQVLTRRYIHVKPVDRSDCSVYAPLYVVLQTIAALHPAIHVMMRFLTAEQAVRLFTMLKWIRRLELSERIYPRYGVASPETHVSRLDVFVQDHDLIATVL